jgi:hypothetical protein
MTSRLITINDIYSFDPNANVSLDDAALVVRAGTVGSPTAAAQSALLLPRTS